MDEWLSKEEIEAKYLHISKHSLPCEGPIKEIIPQKGTDLFKDTWKFLKGLFYITKDGYYFQYNDVCHGNINLNQEGQPYDLFLDGALRCAYSYSLTTSAFGVIEFLMGIISKGNVYVGKNRFGDLYFLFVDFCYTYLRVAKKNSTITNRPYITKEEKLKNLKKMLHYLNSQYEDISKVGHFWKVKEKNSSYQLYDVYSQKFLENFYDEIVYYTETSFEETGDDDYFVRKGRLWGCLDGDGNIKIDYHYHSIKHLGGYIGEGYIVTIDCKEGLLSGEGECILPCQYDKIDYLTEARYNSRTLYRAIKDRKISVLDEQGHCLEKDLEECAFIGSFSNGKYENYKRWDVFWVKKDGIGTIIRENQFESNLPILYNKFTLNGKNKKRCALGLFYNSYKEGSYNNHVDSVIAIVEKGGFWGVVDVKGRVLIDFIYEDLCMIGEDKFKAKKESKYGIVSFGKIIVEVKYDDIVPVRRLYIGTVDGNKYLLDENGNLLYSNFIYDDVQVEYDENVIVGCSVKKGDYWGFLKRDGFLWIPCCYESIRAYTYNNTILAFEVRLDGKYGAIDVKQNVLVKCLYKELHFFKTELYNIFIYKKDDKSAYCAYIDSEFLLNSKNYRQIQKELEDRGLGRVICVCI